VRVLRAIAEIISETKRSHDHHRVHRHTPPFPPGIARYP
jgi:hypothetical protein